MPIALAPFGFPWGAFNRDSRHSAHSNTVGPADPSVLGPPWPYSAARDINSSPVIDYAGTAFFGSLDGWLHAVDSTGNGRPLFYATSPLRSSPTLLEAHEGLGEQPAVRPAVIYFGTTNGRIVSLTPEGGLRWSLWPGHGPGVNLSPLSSPVAMHLPGALAAIYACAADGHVYAVAETGPASAITLWEAITIAPLTTSPALSPDYQHVYVGATGGRLFGFDALSGAPLPNTPWILRGRLWTPVVGSDGTIYVTSRSGTLFALDPAGQVRWQVRVGQRIWAPPALGLDGDLVVLADDVLHVISGAGAPLWQHSFPGRQVRGTAPVTDAAGTTYVAADQGWVFGVARQPTAAGNRLLWAVQVDRAGPQLTTPALDGHGRIYVGASDSRLYAIDEVPAFQLACQSDLSSPGNIDIHSIREVYGIVDPARTRRLTSLIGQELQPAYSLDQSVIAYVSIQPGWQDAFLATANGTDEQNVTAWTRPVGFPAAETDVAFTPIDDLTGISRPPHKKRYLAMTIALQQRRLVFLELEAQAQGTTAGLSFTDWAGSLGVPAAITQQLQPPDTEQSQIAFAPDGKKVAWRHDEPTRGVGWVQVLALQGATWQLWSVGPSYVYNPEEGAPRWGDEPCFAPDSRWLVVREGAGLTIYDVTGRQPPLPVRMPGTRGAPTHPNWAPDGSAIAIGLNDGNGVDLYTAAGPLYSTLSRLTTSGASDEPHYHYFKMPRPRAPKLNPDRQCPGATIEILGRGFDIRHPQQNKVYFAHAQNGARLSAEVLGAEVNPHEGLGVIRVRVPDFAGHGPITVETRFGSCTSPTFYVLPKPISIRQPRSVPGAKVRVFGLGFDLTQISQHTISFTGAAGGFIAVPAIAGGPDGPLQYLDVEVPRGIADTGPVRVDNAYGGCVSGCVFTQLHPRLEFRRTVDRGPSTGLPQYALQGATGVAVQLSGKDFPYDPYFRYGVGSADVVATALAAPAPPVAIRTLPFARDTDDTAQFGPQVFAFPDLGPAHPGGDLIIQATDRDLSAAKALAPFRVPLTDIPIIFVPGTSGNSLDLSPAIPEPVAIPFAGDMHFYPWLCRTCVSGIFNPLGPEVHSPQTFVYQPGTGGSVPGSGLGRLFQMPYPADPKGRRVWVGAEFVAYMHAWSVGLDHVGNHYLDILAFNQLGTPLYPDVGPGTVFYEVPIGDPVPLDPTSIPYKPEPVYKAFIDFLNFPNPPLDWPGRPICYHGPTGVCWDSNGAPASGKNAVYLFAYDWRASHETEQARLAAYIDAVLARPDVTAKKVVLVTHSYGGPIARAYYLNPANNAEQKVDQVISLAGGFLGVPGAFDALERGSTWNYEHKSSYSSVGIQTRIGEYQTKALAQNWPTAYFQMPNSEDWFYDHGSTVTYNLPGGVTIPIVVNRSYVRDGRAHGLGELSSYAASMAWVSSRHNGTLTAAQMNYFAPGQPSIKLGDFRSGTGGIYHHRIISRGLMDTVVATAFKLAPTAAAVLGQESDWTPTEWSWPVYGDGDGTVTYHGALGRTDPRDDRVYVIDGVIHADLPNVVGVLGGIRPFHPSWEKGLLQLLLEGSICSQPQGPQWFQSQNEAPEFVGQWAGPAYGPLSSPPAPVTPILLPTTDAADIPRADRLLIEVRGIAELTIVDADGRRTGPGREPLDPRWPEGPMRVHDEIPGVHYRPGDYVTSAFLTRPSAYTLTIRVPTSNPISILLTVYNRVGAFLAFWFKDVGVSEQGEAHLTWDMEDPFTAPVLVLDPEGNGQRRLVQATVLDHQAAVDRVPPRTHMRISEGRVTVYAVDNPGGAGVLRTYYTTDGVTREIYTEPFVIPADAKIVMAYSEDRTGNLEYPGATRPVLGLGSGQVAMRGVAGSKKPVTWSVEVLNLDPISVTGQLEWEALPEAPWISVHPGRGTTPARLRVSLNSEALAPGTYDASVTVRSATVGAIFAERHLAVRFQVRNPPLESIPADSYEAWEQERRWWQERLTSASDLTDKNFKELEAALRYGFESGLHNMGRQWADVEPDLRTGWERLEGKGTARTTWDDVKEVMHEAWGRARAKYETAAGEITGYEVGGMASDAADR